MIYLGVDPGIEGAIAAIESATGAVLGVHDIDRSVVGAVAFIRDMSSKGECAAIIEKVDSFGMGRQSAMNFGETRGHLRGACIALGIPIIDEPVPTKWKVAVGISLNPPKTPWKRGFEPTDEERKQHEQAKARYKRSQKDKSRERARELYPLIISLLTRVEDNDRAEAILLAHYGRMKGAMAG